MKKRFLVLGFITLTLILVLSGCSQSIPEDLSDVSPHDIQSGIDKEKDEDQKEQVWRQYKGKRVRWVGELVKVVRLPEKTAIRDVDNLEIVELGISIPLKEIFMGSNAIAGEVVVGIFSPGGWGLHRPENLNVDVGEKKPRLEPGGEGVFSPGGWGLVAVIFGPEEAEQIIVQKTGSGMATGKRQFDVGDSVVFEGRLSSVKGIAGGEIGSEHKLSSEQKTEVNRSHFGLTDGIVLGGIDTFFDI